MATLGRTPRWVCRARRTAATASATATASRGLSENPGGTVVGDGARRDSGTSESCWALAAPGATRRGSSATRMAGGRRLTLTDSAVPGEAFSPDRLLDLVVDLEHRQVHRDHDEADDGADNHDHHRLEDRGQGLDRRLHLLLVEVRDLGEHGLEGAG